jgi:hypothetical protein
MDWPHAPLHRFSVGEAVFFVTGSTYLKQHFATKPLWTAVAPATAFETRDLPASPISPPPTRLIFDTTEATRFKAVAGAHRH